jgi:prolyl-tRNA synthetase
VGVDGDRCARCGDVLKLSRGIEVGHVFQLGTKYSKILKATFQDAAGEAKPYVMGCYGIGVNRIAAAAIESFADEAGIVWPPAIAPYEVAVLPLDMSDKKAFQAAQDCYRALTEAGVDVILDDRVESAGFKFKDADLIGFPLRIVVGKGYLKTGRLEMQIRRDGSKAEVAPQDMVGKVREALAQLSRPARAQGG